MKKISIILFSLLFIMVFAKNSFAEDMKCSVGLYSSSTVIQKETNQIKIELKLIEYQGDGTLGYEGKIEYDKNVFESVTIKQASNWESVTFEPQTGKFVSTTTNAKIGSVATIVLNVKSSATAKTSNVIISDLTFSDGATSATLNKTITYTLAKNNLSDNNTGSDNANNSSNNNNTGNSNTNNNSNNNNTGSNNANNSLNNNNTDNNNAENSNNNSGNNNNNNSNNIETKNNTITTEKDDEKSNNQIQNISVNELSKNKIDSTTATKKIPQTGGNTTFILIAIISIIAIICYIRYRSIQIK